jgi:glycopeptide antibiotics resistance protein
VVAVKASRILALLGLITYIAFLAVVLLYPTSGSQSAAARHLATAAQDLGVSPLRATQERAELVANMLLLMPLSALGSMVWPRSTWRDWTAWSFVLACVVELTQGLLLPGRTAAMADVVANTLGGALGACAVAACRRLLQLGRPDPR